MNLCHMVGLYKMTVKFKLLRNDSDDSEIAQMTIKGHR